METEIYKNLSLENLPNEEWRDVVGYEGSYMVSNLGRVKSLDRYIVTKRGKKKLKGTILRQHLCHGYCLVGLGRDKNSQKVHQLVARTFILNTQKLPIINHKNEIKSDNRAENLEWCDYSYNLNYGSRKGWQRKVNGVSVCQYTLEGNFIKKYSSAIEAAELNGLSSSNILHVCNKDKPSAGGYVWRYKGDEFGVFEKKNLSKVKQYSKDGTFIAQYNSIKEASEATGIIKSGISNCVLGLSLSSGGYIWKYDDGDCSNIHKYINPVCKSILCFDIEGNFIKEFDSIAKASKELNVWDSTISECCKGKIKQTKGYIFKHKQ